MVGCGLNREWEVGGVRKRKGRGQGRGREREKNININKKKAGIVTLIFDKTKN